MSNTGTITFPDPPSESIPALILGTLAQLKTFLLPYNQVAETEWDVALTHLGKGAAGQLQRACNRELPRVSGATQTFAGDSRLFSVARYPIESVTTFEVREDVAEGWTTETPDYQLDPTTGLVKLYTALGSDFSLVRLTFTGGYWVDESADGSGTLPTGATELPEDLKLAWLLQCQHIWNLRDNVGAAALTKKDYEAIAITRLMNEAKGLAPQVEDLVRPFRKMS